MVCTSILTKLLSFQGIRLMKRSRFLARIELNLRPNDLPHESVQELQMEDFMEGIVDLLQSANRMLVFGPSDDKYTLFKTLQTQRAFTDLEKIVLVAPFEEQPAHAQLFFEHYFTEHSPF